MKRSRTGLIAALMATTGVVAGVNAQTVTMSLTNSGLTLALSFAAEPEAAKKHDEKALKVIDTYVEKIGGKDLIMSIKSMHTSGTISIPMMGINGKVDVYAAQPGRMATVMDLPGLGRIETGYDGEYGWNSDPMSGPSLMDEEQIHALAEQSDPNAAAKHRELYSVIEYQGETDFQGQKAHKLRLVRAKGGMEATEFYSTDTGLLLGQESIQPSPMGEMKILSVMSDYKEFDGMKMPTRLQQSIGPNQMVTTIDSVTLNKVDPAVFKRPPAIEALIQAKNEG